MESKLDPTTKRWLIIGVGAIILLSILFVVFKFFIFKPPTPKEIETSLPEGIIPSSPEGVAIKFLLAFQEGRKNEERQYLFPDLSKVEILKESYLSAISKYIWIPKSKEGTPPEFKVLEKKENANETNIKIEEITNRRKGDLFFGFLLPEKINFEITLQRVDKDWKIIKVNSEDLVIQAKIGEKVKLNDSTSIKVVSFNGGLPQNINLEILEPERKFIFLKVEYENLSQKENKIGFLNNWSIGSEKESVSVPIIFDKKGVKIEREKTLGPNEKIELFLIFEVPQTFLLKTATFQNNQRKVIFEI